jgi:hypothetical protein
MGPPPWRQTGATARSVRSTDDGRASGDKHQALDFAQMMARPRNAGGNGENLAIKVAIVATNWNLAMARRGFRPGAGLRPEPRSDTNDRLLLAELPSARMGDGVVPRRQAARVLALRREQYGDSKSADDSTTPCVPRDARRLVHPSSKFEPGRMSGACTIVREPVCSAPQAIHSAHGRPPPRLAPRPGASRHGGFQNRRYRAFKGGR